MTAPGAATVLLQPRTMAEVDRIDPEVTLLAGGTDLLVQRRAGARTGPMADISRLADAPPPVHDTGEALRLSALAPLSAVAAGLGDRLPGLRAAIACFASGQIRNRATLGGNISNASPAADTVPPLVAVGGIAALRGPGGDRRVPVADLATAPRRTGLRPGEWIVSVDVPWRPGEVAGFRKVAGRRALAISIVNLAWCWSRRSDGALTGVRLAAGAVAPVVVRCPNAERAIEGRVPTRDVIAEATEAINDDIRPISDLRASAGYRRAALAGALAEALLLGVDEETENDRAGEPGVSEKGTE
ncbi:xanthine dehydrogenase family protein subunit M [Actinoallomurus oryzae]|uniref:Xanthine dehydrogenase family protein subunit M n=1 Tax=Actinoallomurus oryzae TaxID=502180 RepID=A0ABP8Q4V6_9ACTN